MITSACTWPPRLQPGDTVAALAPAGPPSRGRSRRGVHLLKRWGLHVRLGPASFGGHASGFLAAPDHARLADLHAAWADPQVAAICCLRGGYGSQRLLDQVDWELARANPKAFVGFSDITALHIALRQRAHLVTFHGPSLQWDEQRLGDEAAASLREALLGEATAELHAEPLTAGVATAPLVGGNLTILSTVCGTADQLDATGCVLLVEDVGEAPYRIDRALTHLRRAGVLAGVAGLACGTFDDCGPAPGTASVDARTVLGEHAAALEVPAVYGLPLGHGPGQRTVPLGGLVTLDGHAGTLSVHGRRGVG